MAASSPGGSRRVSLKRSKRFDPRSTGPRRVPRVIRYLLALAATIIVIDALFGDRGLSDTLRARREYAQVEAQVNRLRTDNARLREEARRLREDPGTIEALARDELGLIRPGELLFILTDAVRATRPQ